MTFLKAENTGAISVVLCPPGKIKVLEIVCVATGNPPGIHLTLMKF
jgi:hypothetical protein